jgi:hypothetical protein
VGAFLLSFNEFDFGYVQHQFSRSLALGRQESLQPELRVELCRGQQAGLGLEGYGADLGLHGSGLARFIERGFMENLELDRRNSRRREPQRAQLKQPAAQL